MVQLDKSITELLSKNRIFEGLTSKQINEILPCIVHRIGEYKEGECVYKKGHVMRDLGIVTRGKLKTGTETSDGTLSSVQTIEPNGLFGEMLVFSTEGNLTQQVIATEGTQVLFLSGDFFLHQCGKEGKAICKGTHTEVVKNMLRILSDNAIILGKKIAYLTAPDLKTKIAMYLCELYELSDAETFHMPLNRDRLADFFSVARPSLSREFMNLKNQNIIDFYRSNVTIMDIPGLYRLARGE